MPANVPAVRVRLLDDLRQGGRVHKPDIRPQPGEGMGDVCRIANQRDRIGDVAAGMVLRQRESLARLAIGDFTELVEKQRLQPGAEFGFGQARELLRRVAVA